MCKVYDRTNNAAEFSEQAMNIAESSSLLFVVLPFGDVQLCRAFSASYRVSADNFSNNPVFRKKEHKLRDIPGSLMW